MAAARKDVLGYLRVIRREVLLTVGTGYDSSINNRNAGIFVLGDEMIPSTKTGGGRELLPSSQRRTRTESYIRGGS